MAADRLCVLDIETIKDPNVLGKDWPDNKFPPPLGWKVVAVGMLIASRRSGAHETAFGVSHLGCIVGDEADILQKFWSFFSKRETCVITWNGRGFDLPVLLHRSLIHKINAGGWFQSADRYGGYQYRYSADRHCDLMDQMSDYGASTKVGLDMVAKALGLPGKQEVTGADVADLYAAGRLQDIAAYCETDVLNLYGVYLRWCLMTGRLTEVDHDAAVDDLAGFLSRDGIPHRMTFKGQCSTSFLNAQPQPSAAIGFE